MNSIPVPFGGLCGVSGREAAFGGDDSAVSDGLCSDWI
jgi:hypothetical protein